MAVYVHHFAVLVVFGRVENSGRVDFGGGPEGV